MVVVFWLSCAVVAYVYAGYPALLMAWARLRPRTAGGTKDAGVVGVSIVIAARNEARRLASRIDNLLALDCPGPRQIIVVSDGSTDDTLDVLAQYRGVVDVVQVTAGGKARALNAGVARAEHDIVVFADARQVFARDALVQLTASFSDPKIGAVTGELLLDCESPGRRFTSADRRVPRGGSPGSIATERRGGTDRRRTVESTIADGVGLYWRYEKQIRRFESVVGSTLGATGAIYAMRRSLWQPLPAETILDDVLAPMRGVLAGYLTVQREGARVRPGRTRRRCGNEPESANARRQLPDPVARAPAGAALAQPGVAAVRVAQARAAGRSLRDVDADRLEHRRRQPISPLRRGTDRAVFVLPAGRLRRLARTARTRRSQPDHAGSCSVMAERSITRSARSIECLKGRSPGNPSSSAPHASRSRFSCSTMLPSWASGRC